MDWEWWDAEGFPQEGEGQNVLSGSAQFHENEAESEEMTQQVFCYRAGDETGYQI